MRFCFSSVTIFLLTVFLTVAPAQVTRQSEAENRNSEAFDHDQPALREQWFRHGRVVPGESAAHLLYRAHRAKVQMRALKFTNQAHAALAGTALGTWKPLGPAPLASDATGFGGQDYGWVAGRANAVAIDPADSSGNTVYLGGAFGGVWKSTNAATANSSAVNWTPLLDNQPTLAVGSIAVQPQFTNPDPTRSVILVGTGETNSSGDSYYGLGILRSTDAGNSWNLISQDSTGTRSFAGLGFSRIAFSTANSNLVVAGAAAASEGILEGLEQPLNSNRGLYYSTDAGANWAFANISDSAITTAPSSVTSVVYNAAAGEFLAAIRWHGFYISNDGINWSRLTNQPGGLSSFLCPVNPTSQVCPFYRGEIAVVPGRNEMYVWYVDNSNDDGGIWRSTDGGISWSQINSGGIDNCGDRFAGCGTAQGFFDLELAAMPNGVGTDVYAGAVNLYKCTLLPGATNCNSGSSTFLNLTHAYGCPPSLGSIAHVHPDQHALDFLLVNGKAVMYFANDGGVYRALDGYSGLTSEVCGTSNAFDNLNQALGSMAQFISFSQHPSDVNTILGGTQDNGSPATSNSQGNVAWANVNEGDGGYTAIDPSNPTTWFTANTGVSIQRCPLGIGCHAEDFSNGLVVSSATVGEDSGAFYTPYILDPQNAGALLVGTCRVWRGFADGSGFSALTNSFENGGVGICTGGEINLVRSLAAGGPKDTPGFSNVIYAGTDGLGPLAAGGGHIWVSTNVDVGSGNWFDRTGSINPGNYPISAIVIDSSDPSGKTAYLAIMGFHVNHVWQTTNGGTSWINFNSNLPDAPANALLLDSGTVYVGTDGGVFSSSTSSPNWSEVGPSSSASGFLPNVPVTALGMFNFGGTKKLRASTYGRGIWELTLVAGPDFQVSVATNSATVFAGSSAAYNGNLTALNGYNSTVNLTCAAGATQPPTCAFSPTSGKPLISGAGFGLSASGPGGDYLFNVHAVGTDASTITHNFTLALHVLDFALTPPAPGSVTVKQGATSGAIALSATAAGSFNADVALACSGLPAGAVCNFQPSTVNPVSSSPAPLTLTISTSAATPIGNYSVSIVGSTAGGPQRTQPLALKVISSTTNAPDFTLSVSDAAQVTAVNHAITFHGTLTAVNGYASSVSLGCGAGSTAQPPTCSVSPLTMTPAAAGTSFSISAASDVPQNYNFNIVASGSDAAQTFHTAALTLAVGFDFSFSNLSTAQTVSAGQTASYNLDLRPLGNSNFPAIVSLACPGTGLPALTTCTFTPPQVSPGSGETNVLLSIRTTGPVAASPKTRNAPLALWFLFPVGGVVTAFMGRAKAKRLLPAFLLLVLTSCGGGGLSGGGSGAAQPGTPPGNYSITVTASSSSSSHSVQAAMTVQ